MHADSHHVHSRASHVCGVEPKLLTYLRPVVNTNVDQLIVWAGEQGQPLVKDVSGMTFGDTAGEVQELFVAFHAQFVPCTMETSLLVGPHLPWGLCDGGNLGHDAYV